MAKDDLLGNMATEKMIEFLESKSEKLNLNKRVIHKSLNIAKSIFLT